MTAHVEDTIERYFEGRVAHVEERDALFGHLDRCTDCRARFDEIASVHRVFGNGGAGAIPATELALLRASVVSGAARERRFQGSRIGTYVAALLAPAAAAVAFAFFALPRADFATKGDFPPQSLRAAIEVICFDEAAKVQAHLTEDGGCPAPGYLKLVYASPRSVPHLLVAAISGDEIRVLSRMKDPEPRSVLPEHVAIKTGERIRIVAVLGDPPVRNEELRSIAPMFTVTGVGK